MLFSVLFHCEVVVLFAFASHCRPKVRRIGVPGSQDV